MKLIVMSGRNRQTVFIEDDLANMESISGQRPGMGSLVAESNSTLEHQHHAQQIPRNRFPVRKADEDFLVRVLCGTPWKYYEKRYSINYWCSFGVITSIHAARDQFMIRTISGSNTDEQIQNIRRIFHENIVRNIEIYTSSESSYYLISEFMATSLLHVCRSPAYPTEPQLSSILYQVSL